MQQTFRKDQEKMDYSVPRHPEFRYKTEFQSHEPEVLCIFHWQFVLHQYEHVWLLDSWNFWIQISWYQTQLCNIYKSLSVSFEITFFLYIVTLYFQYIYSYTLFQVFGYLWVILYMDPISVPCHSTSGRDAMDYRDPCNSIVTRNVPLSYLH